MNIKQHYIIQTFKDLKKLKGQGYYLSGVYNEGEYKEWYDNKQLWKHCFYKNGKLHGEFKRWETNGQMIIHCWYKNGELHGDYKEWNISGKLVVHRKYKDGVRIS